MDITSLSARYSVRRLTPDDAPVVYALCRENTLYYRYCPPFVTEQSIIADMAALPPRKTLDDKYFLGFFDGEKLIAVLDLITAFPDEKTAFIGFFMTDVSVQHAGVGSGIIRELCAALPPPVLRPSVWAGSKAIRRRKPSGIKTDLPKPVSPMTPIITR